MHPRTILSLFTTVVSCWVQSGRRKERGDDAITRWTAIFSAALAFFCPAPRNAKDILLCKLKFREFCLPLTKAGRGRDPPWSGGGASRQKEKAGAQVSARHFAGPLHQPSGCHFPSSCVCFLLLGLGVPGLPRTELASGRDLVPLAYLVPSEARAW